MKYILYTAIFGLACFSVWLIVSKYGDSKWQEGRLSAINAQQSTDMAHLVSWAEQQQKINNQVLTGLEGLNAYQTTDLDPAISNSIKWVRDTRKPQGR
jgi:hypothetical protein